MNNLGNNIKERRILLGLTQQQLAERIGVSSRSVINKIEKGERNITQKMIGNNCYIFYCPITFVFPL